MTLQEIKFLRLIHKLTSKTEQAFYYDEFNCSMHLYENSSVELPCKELSTEIISLGHHWQSGAIFFYCLLRD